MIYVVVAYDIGDNRRRLRVARKLYRGLERVQRSVFEGEIPARRLERLVGEVIPLLEEQDSLRVYPLCRVCRRRIQVYGQGPVLADPDVWVL